MAEPLPRDQVGFAAAELVLQPSALGDVAIHDVLGDLAPGDDNRGRDQRHLNPLSVARAPNGLRLDPLTQLGDAAAEPASFLLQLLGYHQRAGGPSYGFVGGVAEQAGEFAINPEDLGLETQQRDSLGSLIEQLVQLRGAFPELGLRAPPLTDLGFEASIDLLELGGSRCHPFL